MGSVGGEKYGFGIKWMNCGALMNQFFGTPLFAVVNILVLCLLTVLFAICSDISLITPAC
jgi:hypothetical protein